jgi:hypothetical protein
MPVYFLVLDADLFHRRIAPALTACWRQRRFAPCRDLCDALRPAGEPQTLRAAEAATFDRDLWRLLVGEVLLHAADEVPEVQTAPETLAALLGADDAVRRAHFGSRELVFGGFYRPDRAGYNDADDVRQLAAYLEGVDSSSWTAAALADVAGPDPQDREDELAFARGCFADLRALYRRSAEQGRVIVCEVL